MVTLNKRLLGIWLALTKLQILCWYNGILVLTWSWEGVRFKASLQNGKQQVIQPCIFKGSWTEVPPQHVNGVLRSEHKPDWCSRSTTQQPTTKMPKSAHKTPLIEASQNDLQSLMQEGAPAASGVGSRATQQFITGLPHPLSPSHSADLACRTETSAQGYWGGLFEHQLSLMTTSCMYRALIFSMGFSLWKISCWMFSLQRDQSCKDLESH